MSLAAVILAGGASSRLGEPKALADIGGSVVLTRILTAIADGLESPPCCALVVTGAHHEPISKFLSGCELAAEIARNSNWSAGRTTSVQAAALRRPGLDLLVWPVDVPLVPATILRSLESKWRSLGCPAMGWLAPMVVAPLVEDGAARTVRYGHPIVVGRALAARVHGLGPADPLRSLRAAAQPLGALPVEDGSVLDDLDTPGDLARLRARSRRAVD